MPTLFGYTNHRFYNINAGGDAVWCETRRMRDARVTDLVTQARAAGLSDPESCFERLSLTALDLCDATTDAEFEASERLEHIARKLEDSPDGRFVEAL